MLWLGLVLLAVAGLVFAVQTVRHALPNETKTVAIPTPTPSVQVASLAVAPSPPIAPPPPPSPPVVTSPEVTEQSVAVAEEAPVETPELSPIGESTVPQSAPSMAPVIAHDTPSGVVHRYYSYLADHNTIKAYELLSTVYRQRETFVVYTRSFASTQTLRFVSAKETSRGAHTATISVTFDKQNQRFGWIRWHGPIQLVLENGSWRIDSVKGLTPSSIRR
jgi:hypothetical protein